MHRLYVDRGIIKWNSYDALVGYSSMLQEMRYRLGKKDRPSLCDDAYEELNHKLQEAIITEKDIELRYYRDGYIRVTFGAVKKINYEKKEITLSTWEKFQADDIIEINFR
ncbi:MAG: YolD-like family protein [Candidatus Izemoplasmatales bacterium]|jgi:hypothetical protein